MNSVDEFKNSVMEKAKNYVNESNSFNEDSLTIKLSRNDIKKEMNRERLKSTLLDKVKKSFENSHCSVDTCGKDICVTIPAKNLKKTILTLDDLK